MSSRLGPFDRSAWKILLDLHLTDDRAYRIWNGGTSKCRRICEHMLWSPLLMEQEPACLGSHPDLFFDPTYEDVAKAICHTCKLRNVCLAEGIQETAFGVWGEATQDERIAMTNSVIEIRWG